MNTDTKILSRVLAERIKPLLNKLISPEQLAFVAGRQMVEGNRLIEYLIEYSISTGLRGLIVAIDFKKAFDSVSHEYLFDLLTNFNIPEYYIQAVKTLMQDGQSCVNNDGAITENFPLGRSCRQGDPLAPYLFILAIEPLLRRLKSELAGVQGPTDRVVLSAYADDLTLFVRSETDLQRA